MLLMMKKYINYFLSSILIYVLLSVLLLKLTHGNVQTLLFAGLTCGIFVYFSAIGPIFGSEQYEEKNKGYEFLNILPLRELEIVGAKFLWVFLIDAVFVGGILLFLSRVPWPEKQLILFRSLALVNGTICLLLAAVSYVFIFWIGYTKYMIGVMSVMVALGLVPMLIMWFFRDDIDKMIVNIYNFLVDINWIMVLSGVLVVYIGFMFLAAKIKKY